MTHLDWNIYRRSRCNKYRHNSRCTRHSSPHTDRKCIPHTSRIHSHFPQCMKCLPLRSDYTVDLHSTKTKEKPALISFIQQAMRRIRVLSTGVYATSECTDRLCKFQLEGNGWMDSASADSEAP